MKAEISLLILVLATSVARAGDEAARFESRVFQGHGGANMPYWLLKPEKIEPGQKYPLVLVLHGSGERGTDNAKQLKDFGAVFLKPDARIRFTCFVLVPQSAGSWVQHPIFDKPIALTKTPATSLLLANEAIKSAVKTNSVDAVRLYLTGYSNGACGVWELLEREPQVWAAAAPLAGAGDPARVGAAKHVPIWAFHGAKDKTIPLERMTELVASLRTTRAADVQHHSQRRPLRCQGRPA